MILLRGNKIYLPASVARTIGIYAIFHAEGERRGEERRGGERSKLLIDAANQFFSPFLSSFLSRATTLLVAWWREEKRLASPRLSSPLLSSPRITSTSPSPLPLYPFSSPPFVHLPLLVFRSFPTLTCFSPVFFSSPLDPLLPTDPVEKGINIGRDETGPRYESRSDFIKVISSRDVDAFDSGDRESESMLRIIECVV